MNKCFNKCFSGVFAMPVLSRWLVTSPVIRKVKILLTILLWFGFSSLFAELNNGEEDSVELFIDSKVATDLPITNVDTGESQEEKLNRIVNRSEFLFYYRGSFVVEITGNEQTFGIALHPDIDYIRMFNGAMFKLTLDFYVLEALSTRGRFFDNFNPPTWYPNDISISVDFLSYNRIQGGIFTPILHTSPQKSYYMPVVFKTGKRVDGSEDPGINYPASNYINHAMVTGHRDLPIIYLITPHYDTGISWRLWINAFEMIVSYSNGEMGLDSNSAKSVSGRFAYHDENLLAGVGFHIGNLASVPIKEYNHMVKGFAYYTFAGMHYDVTIGAEGLLRLHGLRDLEVLGRGVDGEFQYGSGDGFFDPFTVYYNGLYDHKGQIYREMLYGLAALLYLEMNIYDFFSVIHGSYYDPNLLNEEYLMYQRRYRVFASFGYKITPFFKVLASYTFSYDRYFTTTGQFYDSTEPRAIHPIVDMDFYIGFVFDIYHTDTKF